MLDLSIYRYRIGTFSQKVMKSKFNSQRILNDKETSLELMFRIYFILSFLQIGPTKYDNYASSHPTGAYIVPGGVYILTNLKMDYKNSILQKIIIPSVKESPNFTSRMVNGNIKRGIVNMHLNIRSLYNKLSEIKKLVKKEKPHILGVSEAELWKKWHDIKSLAVPGYDLLLPLSWNSHGRARIVVYVKKTMQYEQIRDLEDHDLQTIWLRAGFKNMKQIFISHQYREHTNCMGSSMACQKEVLQKMVSKWEIAATYETHDSQNELHIMGDFNLDCYKGKWLNGNYCLKPLATMVLDTCNILNLTQIVNQVTRIQYNSVSKEISSSCLDHLYCNAKYRISDVSIISTGASDHDGILYTRYAKEPLPPRRTIRKRSYKNFNEADFIRDVASIDFSDVYMCRDVDDAASILTKKLVEKLNFHAPWIIFQERKHFAPWISADTLKMMDERDKIKFKAKSLNKTSVDQNEQYLLWENYKKIRNKVSNRLRCEEINFKKLKFTECCGSSSKSWNVAKRFMNWSSAGPPTQLEVLKDNKLTLCTKAADIAQSMNEFFVSKVQKILNSLKNVPVNLNGCKQIMEDRDISLSLSFVRVEKIKKYLRELKPKTSSSIDQLDNYSVRLVADFIAQPLHHVITLSILQGKFPSCWKLSKIIPLHKKQSQLKRENYRPVAILSPLSKILEKVIYVQMYNYFETRKLFHPSLHGYRDGRSTMTALLSMYDKWVSAANDGKVSGIVLVDLSAAFDLVPASILIEKLKIYGLDQNFIDWIHSYLTDRHQSVWIDHIFSCFLKHDVGVPQGSLLGPLLFLIYFNDLPTFINGQIDCYADDSTLGTNDPIVDNISEQLTADCSSLRQWMDANKFKLNGDKTHVLVVGTASKLRKINGELSVELDGKKLKQSEQKSEVLLGVHIQADLKWSCQVESLIGRLKIRLAAIEKLRFSVSYHFRKILVDGLFNSVLCYCLPVFGGSTNGEIEKLQVLQNRAAQLALNVPPRTHRVDMFERLGWMTVQQLIAYHTLIVILRVRLKGAPEHLAEQLTRENRQGKIVLKNSKLDLYRKSFIFRGATLWNKLPDSVKNVNSVGTFKRNVKQWIFNNVDRFIS